MVFPSGYASSFPSVGQNVIVLIHIFGLSLSYGDKSHSPELIRLEYLRNNNHLYHRDKHEHLL